MDRIKPWDWQLAGSSHRLPRRVRHVCAWALSVASVALDGMAQRLAAVDDSPARLDRRLIEFHAESGAPEGALYIDGKLVGWIDGVRRL